MKPCAILIMMSAFALAAPASVAAAAQKEKVLHVFGSAPDGQFPGAGLAADGSGNLYGTTHSGGSGNGTAFSLSPRAGKQKWSETILYSFCGQPACSDGAAPNGPLLFSGGAVYGTTFSGGVGVGMAFVLSPPPSGAAPWLETILYSFGSAVGDGYRPSGPLIQDEAGNLYGATLEGGSGQCTIAASCGTVFGLSPPSIAGDPWTEVIIYQADDFDAFPSGVQFDGAGNILVTTAEGGIHHYGSIFRLTHPAKAGQPWGYQSVYAFAGGADGSLPAPGLAVDSAGNIFGATE